MKEMVVYFSETGFTKKYVESIERRIPGIEVKFIKNLKKKDVLDKDMIIYAGPIRGNKILGLDKFLKHYKHMEDKEIFILGVGIGPISETKKENVIYANGLEFYHVRLFLLPGGMSLKNMKPMKRKMLQVSMKFASKKNPMVKQNLDMFERELDLTNINLLDPILDKYHIVKVRRMNKENAKGENN